MDYLLADAPGDGRGFSKLYLNLRERFLASGQDDRAGGSTRQTFSLINEKSIKVIWYEKRYNADALLTVDGKKISVENPGEWNLGPGPDFTGAEIKIDGRRFSGDIEVHGRHSDWQRRRSGAGHESGNTVLLVFLIDDRPKTSAWLSGQFFRKKNIPQLCLGEFINPEIMSPAGDIGGYPCVKRPARGGCGDSLTSTRYDYLFRLINSAGDGRMWLKSRRYALKKPGAETEQSLYEAVCESLGYKANKQQMLSLAKKVALKKLKPVFFRTDPAQRAIALQSVFFNMAGLLPERTDGFDEETKIYAGQLGKIWEENRHFFNDVPPLKKEEWCFGRIRPVGYPTRRIAGLSYILCNFLANGFERAFLKWAETLTPGEKTHGEKIFFVTGRGYFAARTKFGSSPMARPSVLIGADRSRTMIVNVVIPYLLQHALKRRDARLEKALSELYACFPQTEENMHVKMFSNRLFGNGRKMRFREERVQQGLIQMFSDFCDVRVDGCRRCALPHIIRFSPQEFL